MYSKSLDSVTKTVVPAFKNGLRLNAEKVEGKVILAPPIWSNGER